MVIEVSVRVSTVASTVWPSCLSPHTILKYKTVFAFSAGEISGGSFLFNKLQKYEALAGKRLTSLTRSHWELLG